MLFKTKSKDQKILKTYKNGKYVSKKDFEDIKRLANIGLIKMGVSLKETKVTAKTTPLGKKFI